MASKGLPIVSKHELKPFWELMNAFADTLVG